MLHEEKLPDILEKIITRRRERLAVEGPLLSATRPNYTGTPSDTTHLPGTTVPAPVPFIPHGSVICEIKRRSPSRGSISDIASPVELAETYRRYGAAALSVLTEEDHFGGSLSDLSAVKDGCPDLPVLRKDFLFGAEDVRVSRDFGADAILLITRILGDEAMEEIFTEADLSGLAVLAEAHSLRDIERLRPFAPGLVGINCRDLSTFRIDPLDPPALAASIDWPAKLVWESGIFGFEGARVAAASGFEAVLIGEGAIRRPEIIPEIAAELTRNANGGAGGNNPSGEKEGRHRSTHLNPSDSFFWKRLAARREELRSTAESEGRMFSPKHRKQNRREEDPQMQRPLVKICGITRLEDARAAALEGADILGFVLAPSPRQVDPDFVRSLAETAEGESSTPLSKALRVAVIVEKKGGEVHRQEIEAARMLLDEGAVHAVQLHGDAEPQECAEYAFPYFKALRPSSPEEARRRTCSISDGGYRCPRILIDAFSHDAYGGTGKRLDPAIIETATETWGKPLWLAGGITPENAAEMVQRFSPELIDLSSGLESAPGVKDREKIEALFTALNSPASGLQPHAQSQSQLQSQTRIRSEGYFGRFGGAYVAEVLREPLKELDAAFEDARGDVRFNETLEDLGKRYIGRPTPLLFAENASRAIGGADIYIKLEGLANTGAHKINNAIGQALLARRMGKKRIIAETGAGQHGLATAAACAKLGLQCIVYMGVVDYARQRPNVMYMEMFGAEVVPVAGGSGTLKDAVNEALRDWAGSFDTTHYLLGSALGPAPFPKIVEHFQSVIGGETSDQLDEYGVHPDLLVACVGGGSNAAGFFSPWIAADTPRLLGAEAGGRGETPGDHAARMTGGGREGIFQGYRSLFLLDGDGQVYGTHSISAGLDYPGIGPRLAEAGSTGRVDFVRVSDNEALEALHFFARHEGLLFALESAHAGFAAMEEAKKLGSGKTVVINMSGRGDKDLFITAPRQKPEEWKEFLRSEAESVL